MIEKNILLILIFTLTLHDQLTSSSVNKPQAQPKRTFFSSSTIPTTANVPSKNPSFIESATNVLSNIPSKLSQAWNSAGTSLAKLTGYQSQAKPEGWTFTDIAQNNAIKLRNALEPVGRKLGTGNLKIIDSMVGTKTQLLNPVEITNYKISSSTIQQTMKNAIFISEQQYLQNKKINNRPLTTYERQQVLQQAQNRYLNQGMQNIENFYSNTYNNLSQKLRTDENILKLEIAKQTEINNLKNNNARQLQAIYGNGFWTQHIIPNQSSSLA